VQGKILLLDRKRKLIPSDGAVYVPADRLPTRLAEYATNGLAEEPNGKIRVEF
jgi:hypothetical protein